MTAAYQTKAGHTKAGKQPVEEAEPTVRSALEELVRTGAREMLRRALEEEVDAFLGRGRYERGGEFRGYRNGYAPERTIGTGLGAVPVRAPRVRDVPVEVAPDGYQSQLIPKYQRRTAEQQALLVRLYLEGLSSGDFEPAFRELLGAEAPLSSSTILRLKEDWAEEYRAWQQRSLKKHRYPYIWLDGIYVGCGEERDKSVLLCVLGAREDGQKELLALAIGYRESTESWADVLRDLRRRGLTAPLLAIGDGGLGAWAALDTVFPTTAHQRCWNHRVLNVQDKLPQRLQAEARQALREICEAATRAEAERKRDLYVAKLRRLGQTAAADTVLRDWDDFVTFYDFPQEHWKHLRTSNAIESMFAGVRLRTEVAKRVKNRDNAVYLVFKLIERLGQNWRALNGGRSLMTLLLSGAKFSDGIFQLDPVADALESERAA
jgi:transposase-like protein